MRYSPEKGHPLVFMVKDEPQVHDIAQAGSQETGSMRTPAYASLTLYWRRTYETDISCVLLESVVAPECVGDGIEDRRLGARDTAPQTEHLGESTP